MREEIPCTAVRSRQEDPVDACHFVVERQARLPHDVQRLAACIVTLAIADVDE